MVSYYTVLLLLTLFLQTDKTAVYKTIVTLILVISSVYIMKYYSSHGLSVYESAVRCETIYLVFLVSTIRLHNSWVLFAVTLASLLGNVVYLVTDSYTIQYFIYDNYKLFNIILFECLLYNSINTTRVYLYLKKYLNDMKDNHCGYKKVSH